MKIALHSPADIGALIRDRRKARGLDQAELAALTGVSRLWVNQIESGKPGAGIGLVLRALKALDVRLISEVGEEPETAAAPMPDINAIIDAARRTERK